MTPMSPASLREMICDETVDACSTMGGLDAIILTGSMARDEASTTADHQMTIVLGDAEFLLVFRRTARVPPANAVETLAKIVESRLLRRNVKCRICLSSVSNGFLAGIVPHIFGYELRHCGQVVWGNRDALTRVPPFETSQIPLNDAVRLLCNRMVELLELVAASGLRSKVTKYATVKLYLDMATSFLIFAGAYRPTYRQRLRELEKIAATVPAGSVPFPLPAFVESIEYCTRLKLTPSDPLAGVFISDAESEQLFIDGVRLAHLLWRWELQRCLQLDSNASDEELLARWAGSQPWMARLRGWVRVVRDVNTATTRKNWKRWLKLARQQSPRHGVYAAGCQMFFRIPDLMRGRQTEPFQDLGDLLPISPEGEPKWRSVAASIAQNYHQFVEFTRT